MLANESHIVITQERYIHTKKVTIVYQKGMKEHQIRIGMHALERSTIPRYSSFSYDYLWERKPMDCL